jgi:ABC-2 type transport system permease protein
VIWTVAVAAVSAIYASFYTVMDTGELESLVEGMPEGLVTALGYDAIGSPAGYLESTVFGLLAPLLLLVFGLGLGARIVAGLEEDGTLELELTHPVSRRRVILERYLALVIQVIVLSAATWLVVAAAVLAIDMDVSQGDLAATGLGLLLLTLALSSVAFAVGAVTGRRVIALGAGAAVAVAAYLADALAPMLDDGRWLEAISPFSWYLGSEPLVNGIDPLGFGALLVLSVLALAVAVVTFDRRDLGV